MIEITFAFEDYHIPVRYSMKTNVTEKGITKKGTFEALSSTQLRLLLQAEGVTVPEGMFFANSQRGLELVRQIPSEEDRTEFYTAPGVLSLSLSDPKGVLDAFHLQFGEFLDSILPDDIKYDKFSFEFVTVGESA